MKKPVRQKIRHLRRAVPRAERKRLTRQALSRLTQIPNLRRRTNIGIYWPSDGEMSPLGLLKHHATRNQHFYLPVLPKFRRQCLRFARLHSDDRLLHNRFAIPEPTSRHTHSIQTLDLVIVPLVAFDASGTRLGMGGGYYDRALAGRLRGRFRKPLIVGLAFHFQETTEKLPREAWDVPLDFAITDKQLFSF